MRERNVVLAVILAAVVGAASMAVVYELLSTPCSSECAPCETAIERKSKLESEPVIGQRRASAVNANRSSSDVSSQIDDLREEIARLEAENEKLAERKLEDDPRYYGFSAAELELLARNCDVRADGAPFIISDDFLDAMGVRPDEREPLERAHSEFKEREASRKRDLLIEVGADIEEYDALDPMENPMERELFFFSHFIPDEPDNPNRQKEIARMIAEEKAGLRARPSPTELEQASPYVRFLRGVLSEGDRFAEALAVGLGEERVHELRAVKGGWPGGGRRHFGCPEE